MTLHRIFIWLDQSTLANIVRGSTWMFAAFEVVHLLGLTLLLGTLVVVDLRLFGAGLRDQTISEIAAETMPWTMTGLGLVAGSGIALAVSEASRLYDSNPFMIKMVLFILAIVFTFTFHVRLNKSEPSRAFARVGATVSLLLWFGVGFAGRAIAFF